MTSIFVKPAVVTTENGDEVLPIINPETGKPLPAEGMAVSPTPFWRRRLLDGDVVQVLVARQPKNTSKKGE